MKIIAFSDLHAHPFKPYSHTLETGINNRLQDAINCIKQIQQHAAGVNADLILFGGDLFHVRRHVPTQAFNETFRALVNLSLTGIPIVMIHGNHDQEDRNGRIHSLYPFGSFATVIDEPGWHEVRSRTGEACAIFGVPYVEEEAQLHELLSVNKSPGHLSTVFLGHFGINGATVGSGIVYRSKAEPSSDKLPEVFDIGLLGHFHLHQTIAKNWYYIGAPLQHEWGDKGQKRGFLEIDVYPGGCKKQHITLNAPEFIEIEIGNPETLLPSYKGHYVRIVSDRSWSKDECENTKNEFQCRSLEIIPKKVVNAEKSVRLDIESGYTYTDILDKYVNSGLVDLNDLEAEQLLEFGCALLEEAEQDAI